MNVTLIQVYPNNIVFNLKIRLCLRLVIMKKFRVMMKSNIS